LNPPKRGPKGLIAYSAEKGRGEEAFFAALWQGCPAPCEAWKKMAGRFLKKRRKNFWLHWAGSAEISTAQIIKVFLLLFVHKK
jgi:hypothetical protein